VINLACQKPTDLGYAADILSLSVFADHVKIHSIEEGHDCLKKSAEAMIKRVLVKHPIRSHKMAYYLESRNPGFN
jgi:hypothetical protein